MIQKSVDVTTVTSPTGFWTIVLKSPVRHYGFSLEGKRMNCPCKLIAKLLSRLTAIVLATFQSQGNNALKPTLLNCVFTSKQDHNLHNKLDFFLQPSPCQYVKVLSACCYIANPPNIVASAAMTAFSFQNKSPKMPQQLSIILKSITYDGKYRDIS